MVTPSTMDDGSPSPKRRRTSSSASSSRSLSRTPPRPGSASVRRTLPLRRASSGGPRERDSFSRSPSRDQSSQSDDEEPRTFWRDRSPRREQRRRADSSESTPRSRRSQSTNEEAVHTKSAAPRAAPKQRTLRFKPLQTIHRAHARGLTSLKFSPDGSMLATSSADATINIYSLTAPISSDPSIPLLTHIKTLTGHLAGVNALSWSPSGPPYTLASASDDKSILLWQPTSATPTTPLPPSPLLGHHSYVSTLSFSPKGNLLVSGSFDEAVFLWDVRSGTILRALPAHSDPVGGVDFLQTDGSMVVSCAGDGLVRIWDAGTGQCLRTLVDEERKAVTSVRWTPNGRFVVSWALDGCVRLWDYVAGEVRKTYQGHRNEKYGLGGCIGVAGGEAFLVSGSEDGEVVAWDVVSKEVLWRGEGHRKVVLGVDIWKLPDGRNLLASGGMDKDLRLWIDDGDGLAVNGHARPGEAGASASMEVQDAGSDIEEA